MVANANNRKRSHRQPARSSVARVQYADPSSDDSDFNDTTHVQPLRQPIAKRARYHENSNTHPEPSDINFPSWSSLPYEILLSVFHFAAYPLRDENLRPTQSTNWLVKAATTCKAFVEPALSALYQSPPYIAFANPRNFLHIPPLSETYLDYLVKVKALNTDVRPLAKLQSRKSLPLTLSDMVAALTRLAHLDLTDPIDRPPFRPTGRGVTWHYPPDLFDTLQRSGRRLKSWRWHCHMLRDKKDSNFFGHIHSLDTFQSLRQLSLSHFDIDHGPGLLCIDSLSLLTHVTHFTLNSCSTNHWLNLLRRLPTSLHSLSIINCHALDSNALQTALAFNGQDLKHLRLDHNQALNIDFLATLKSTCPHLESLKMDFTYYSAYSLHKDSHPLYADLLTSAYPPTWPSTLQELELLHLRQLSALAAEVFFGSLLDCAKDLPMLRLLSIKAILDMSWRDRAGFRETWIDKLTTVFLRRPSCQDVGVVANDYGKSQQHLKSNENAHAKSPVDSRRSQRLQRHDMSIRKLSGTSNSTDELSIDTGTVVVDTSPLYIQGLCEIVNISIDNMRPSELRFNESDFMDSEQSGDEDWTGDYEAPSSETRHAW